MPRSSKPAATKPQQVYQFKITLLDVKPLIWRRIQVPEGTLDDLHGHIQTAMGWTNSHLHQFEIGGQRYGDPDLLNDGFDDDAIIDSTEVVLSTLLGKKRKAFRFFYEYDFGDGWRHEILYEGLQPSEPRAKYPRCIDGGRACPPEDVGGPWGYMDFVEVIANPKHKRHRELREWFTGRFDAEHFEPLEASKEMRRGVLDWRD